MSVGLKVDPSKTKWKKKALKALSQPERSEKIGNLKHEEERLLRQMEDHPWPIGTTTEEWQRHIMGKDDYGRLLRSARSSCRSMSRTSRSPNPSPLPRRCSPRT